MSFFPLAKKDITSAVDVHREIERWVDLYGNGILRLAYMYVKDRDRADDIFQEVFLRAYKNYHRFNRDSSEKTWLMTITINVCRDFLKSSWSKKVTFVDSYEEHETSYDIEDTIIQSVENEKLYNEVLKLPPKYKESILLYYYQELDTPEISKVLGIPESTIRSRLFRARDMLKNNLDKETVR